MLTIAATIFVLGVLIFVHELGHFMAAKAVGIAVPRFSIGFGAATPLKFRRGETEYVISWIPFGGYVKMASLEEQQAMAALEGGDLEEEYPPDRLFESKSLPARILVLAAGVIMNALFAWGVYSGLLLTYGQAVDPTTAISRVDAALLPEGAAELAEIPFGATVETINGQAIIPLWEPRVGYLVAGKPAATAGLEEGDLITGVGEEPLPSWDALVAAVERHVGQPMRLKVDRDGETVEIEVTPAEEEVTDSLTGETRKVGRIGIGPKLRTLRTELGVFASIAGGAAETWDNGLRILAFLKGMLLGQVSPNQLGGPILIGQASGQFARAGFVPLLSFMAFLSINLAILNLLPIPVLDGGHLIFLVLEGIRGKPLPQALRMRLTQAGMFLLLGIMLFAVINDVLRIVR